MTSRRLAVANQKGGVGKTTTAVNLGAALADQGVRTLLVDLDPQANATTGLGVDPRAVDRSVYEVLIEDLPTEEALLTNGDREPHAPPRDPGSRRRRDRAGIGALT